MMHMAVPPRPHAQVEPMMATPAEVLPPVVSWMPLGEMPQWADAETKEFGFEQRGASEPTEEQFPFEATATASHCLWSAINAVTPARSPALPIREPCKTETEGLTHWDKPNSCLTTFLDFAQPMTLSPPPLFAFDALGFGED